MPWMPCWRASCQGQASDRYSQTCRLGLADFEPSRTRPKPRPWALPRTASQSRTSRTTVTPCSGDTGYCLVRKDELELPALGSSTLASALVTRPNPPAQVRTRRRLPGASALNGERGRFTRSISPGLSAPRRPSSGLGLYSLCRPGLATLAYRLKNCVHQLRVPWQSLGSLQFQPRTSPPDSVQNPGSGRH